MLELAGTQVDAVSVAGLETCIQLPRHKLAFDIGRGPRSAVGLSTVAFTHSHVDHMGGLAHHVATRSLLGMDPPTYLVPSEVEMDFHALLDALRKIDGSQMPCTVIPARPGEDIPLPSRRFLRPHAAVHTLPALGYSLWREQTRLRPEFRDKSQEEIRDASNRGEEVSEEAAVALVAFTGDSRIEILERESALREAKLLIMEVTFLDGRVDVERARDNGHTHLDEVIERADLFQNEAILFTHLSARYRFAEAAQILERRLPDSLKERVTLLRRPAWCQ
jgi:ribonuclease Z